MSSPSGIVTLLTDFGLKDPYVGVMKGAILQHSRNLQVVDLCHGIAPQAIREGSFWLEKCHAWFPQGTVHLAVVDPTVGTGRAILAVQANSQFFIAPDNGLIPNSLLLATDTTVHRVDWAGLGLHARGATFHGRDIFAPVAAMLASGSHSLAQLGPATAAQPSILNSPTPLTGNDVEGEVVQGEIVAIDHFGNLLTNISHQVHPGVTSSDAKTSVSIGSHTLPLVNTYSDAVVGELLALNNAWGNVEVAVRNGNAAHLLNVAVGAVVLLRYAKRTPR